VTWDDDDETLGGDISSSSWGGVTGCVLASGGVTSSSPLLPHGSLLPPGLTLKAVTVTLAVGGR